MSGTSSAPGTSGTPGTRIVIVGGHGKVAMLLAPILAARGDRVTSLIRNPDHAGEVRAAGADPLLADVEAYDTDAITTAIVGHDAVVWTAGAGGGNPERTYAVDRDAAIRTIDAAELAGVKRFVMVSYFGARGGDHGVAPDSSFFPYAEAKVAADAYLRESGLDWTILGPSSLTLEPPTGLIEVAETGDGVESGEVTRADVAAVIAATLESPSTIGRFIAFNNGDTPIDEAL